MKCIKPAAILLGLASLFWVAPVEGQTKLPSAAATLVIGSSATREITCAPQSFTVGIVAPSSFTVASDADWLTATTTSTSATITATSNTATADRSGTITFTSGTTTKTIAVTQKQNSVNSVCDQMISITGASANSTLVYGGTTNSIDRSYDNKLGTWYHSETISTTNIPTLTYNFAASHIDYITYIPRNDGNTNGLFGSVDIYYSTDGSTYTKWGTYDFGESATSANVSLGTTGIDNVVSVRFIVNSGKNNFASCAEMQFYTKSTSSTDYSIFSDALYTTLKDGTTQAGITALTNTFAKELAQQIYDGNYSTKYRVGEFDAYRPIADLASELKTSTYDSYENPTGIYFRSGEKKVLMVSGMSTDGASLIIKDFGKAAGDHPQSSYALHNGMNIITPSNSGNSYISYYTTNYATAPKIKIHFALGNENGYFSLSRGDNDAYWKTLLANACSPNLDVITQRMHVAGVVDLYKKYCPNKGRELALIYDSVIYRERQIMGLEKYNREPKNHQFARPVDSGMFADGIGAAAEFGDFGSNWCNPNSFSYWGFAHELGHVNQVRPGLKWVSCGETTNNIYSAWVEHTMGTGYHRLEDEGSGLGCYLGLRGGRFECYLEEGVRKGTKWLFQEGPNFYGDTPTSYTGNKVLYDGTVESSTTTTSYRSYDHFVKVVPFWQLLLYTQQIGISPNAFAKVIEIVRTTDETSMTNGKLQINFMRNFCNVTGMNFLPFFKKAGMLNVYDVYAADYTPAWLVIPQTAIDDLTTEIEGKGYASIPEGLNYINAYNWKLFRDKTPVSTAATVGSGCTVITDATLGNRIQVDNTIWNAVAYKTYDASGNLLHITMYGLGAPQQSSQYTQVLWSATNTESPSYINAVGYDGTEVKCYQAQ